MIEGLFKLWVKEPRESDIQLHDVHLAGVDPRLLMTGRPLEKIWSNEIVVTVSGQRPLDVLHAGILFPVLSQRAQDLVRQAGLTGMEFYPVRVIRRDATPAGPYWFANPLSVSGAIDLARSTCHSAEHGTYYSPRNPPPPWLRPERVHFLELVIDPRRVGERDLFRLAEQPRVVYVSRRFVEVARCHRWRGVQFLPARSA